jgi:hypothetical protein
LFLVPIILGFAAIALAGQADVRPGGCVKGASIVGIVRGKYDADRVMTFSTCRGRFPEVPTRTPEEVLASHGLDRGQPQVLDPAKGLAIVSWQSSLKPY